jgi:periplasmic divalent cation tolerance protein
VNLPRLAVVLTTMPDSEAADALARTLVEERLAACVNVHAPMMSSYQWAGALQRDPERQLVIKTSPGRVPDLERRLAELHPYELPEFVVLDAAASVEYAAWVRTQTGEPSAPRGAGSRRTRPRRAAPRR